MAKKSRAQLTELLAEHMDFLRSSANAFDRGLVAEAKRMATSARVLLHDTAQSKSLLQQLGTKEKMRYLDTAGPINPNNLLPTPGLVMMRLDGSGGSYVPKLGDGRVSRLLPFPAWWNQPVMKLEVAWSRRQLVQLLANKEGGAHVDPALNSQYELLSRKNGFGWRSVGSDQSEGDPFTGDTVAGAMRQIAYELLESLAEAGS